MSQTVQFIFDGQHVTASTDETLWQIAKRCDTHIPHLCYSEQTGYRADGNCRACMVEIEGERTLAASCMRKLLRVWLFIAKTREQNKHVKWC